MKKKITYLIFIMVLIISLAVPNFSIAENIIEGTNTTEKKDIFSDIEAPNLLLAETSTGKILYERDAEN